MDFNRKEVIGVLSKIKDMKYVSLEADRDELVISSRKHDRQFKATFTCQGELPKIKVELKEFLKFLKASKEERATIEGNVLDCLYTLFISEHGEDYEEIHMVNILSMAFIPKELYSDTVKFVSKDESRQMLLGTYIHDGKLMATNGYILIQSTIETTEDSSVIIPIVPVFDDLELTIMQKHTVIKQGNVWFTVANIDERFPQVQTIVDRVEDVDRITFDGKAMQEAIKRVKPLTDKTCAVEIRLDNSMLKIGVGESFIEVGECEGEAFMMKLNYKLFLNCIQSGQNTLHYNHNTSHSPISLKGADKSIRIIMPMRL